MVKAQGCHAIYPGRGPHAQKSPLLLLCLHSGVRASKFPLHLPPLLPFLSLNLLLDRLVGVPVPSPRKPPSTQHRF